MRGFVDLSQLVLDDMNIFKRLFFVVLIKKKCFIDIASSGEITTRSFVNRLYNFDLAN